MEEIYSYYKENIDAYTRRLGNLKKKIHLMGSIRLALVVGAILSLWIFRDESWQWLTGITFAYIIPFALLMWYHNKMYARKVYAETLIKLNEDELKGLDYDFSAFDGAADKITGELIMETYGIGPGRVIGDMKEIIKNAILDGEIPNEYDAAYALMERLAAERGLTRVRK